MHTNKLTMRVTAPSGAEGCLLTEIIFRNLALGGAYQFSMKASSVLGPRKEPLTFGKGSVKVDVIIDVKLGAEQTTIEIEGVQGSGKTRLSSQLYACLVGRYHVTCMDDYQAYAAPLLSRPKVVITTKQLPRLSIDVSKKSNKWIEIDVLTGRTWPGFRTAVFINPAKPLPLLHPGDILKYNAPTYIDVSKLIAGGEVITLPKRNEYVRVFASAGDVVRVQSLGGKDYGVVYEQKNPCRKPLRTIGLPKRYFEFIGRPAADGFIPWTGGKNPAPGRDVVVKFRSPKSKILSDTHESSDRFNWKQCGAANDIVGWRPYEPAPRPEFGPLKSPHGLKKGDVLRFNGANGAFVFEKYLQGNMLLLKSIKQGHFTVASFNEVSFTGRSKMTTINMGLSESVTAAARKALYDLETYQLSVPPKTGKTDVLIKRLLNYHYGKLVKKPEGYHVKEFLVGGQIPVTVLPDPVGVRPDELVVPGSINVNGKISTHFFDSEAFAHFFGVNSAPARKFTFVAEKFTGDQMFSMASKEYLARAQAAVPLLSTHETKLTGFTVGATTGDIEITYTRRDKNSGYTEHVRRKETALAHHYGDVFKRELKAGAPAFYDATTGHCESDFDMELENYTENLNNLASLLHYANVTAGWYHDPVTKEPLKRNAFELLALVHSELSEALEGHRKGLQDDKLPDRPMMEVELADALIRILDLAHGLRLDIAGAVHDKVKFNRTRADHKPENRAKDGGKVC